MTRKSLSDILRNGDQERLRDAWQHTEAAADFKPLPAGEYVCHVIAVELFNARTTGTPGVKLAFKVIEGEHADRRLWDDRWLTQTALPWTKRDLGKLGIVGPEQLQRSLPPGIRCKCKVVVRTADDGTEYNRVQHFEVVGIDPTEADAFAPIDAPPGNGQPTASATGEVAAPSEAAEPPPEAPVDASFAPTKLNAETPAGGGT
jgi:hypothetical protein